MPTRYHQLTTNQKESIISEYKKGVEFCQIPINLKVSERSVSRVLVEAGINTRRKNRYTVNENYFDVIDSRSKAYVLGLMASDGCVTSSNYVVFESIDRELTELVASEWEYSGEIKSVIPNGRENPHYRINFSSQKMATRLKQYGVVVGRKQTGEYYFPESKYLASFVLGYFDGDGCAFAKAEGSGGAITIAGSFEFTTELARLLGMGKVVAHNSKPIYYWSITHRKRIKAFYEFVYHNTSLGLKRKKQKFEQIEKGYKRA